MKPDTSLLTLFNEALGREDAAARARFLDDACGEDMALRERVESLLCAHENAGGFLARPSKVQSDSESATRLIPVTEKSGDLIGRYKLLQQIGEGGCGVVYMAEQVEPVRRRVAFKVIRLGMDTEQVVARFEAERQALALMDHPNIAKVLDAGATDTGRPYFVMELVRGVKITEFCDEKMLSTEERLDLFIQVCSAIQHAHQKGIIHRDLKPSNVLVTTLDGKAIPKVIDFGIAKATSGQELTDKTLFTAFEQFIGTPAYMSPEQAEISAADIDTRSDIYSLGVLLYELLTGKTPFDAQELIRSGVEGIRKTLRELEPVKPSTKLNTLAEVDLTTVAKSRHVDAPKLIHAVRGDLDWVVMKCLEKDRARRYESANGLAADLQRHLTNEPILARPPSTTYRLQKAFRRNKLAFAATAAIALTLIVGLAASLWQAVRATRAEGLAEQRLEKSEQAEKLAGQRLVESEQARAEAVAISRFLSEVFLSPLPTRDGRKVTVFESMEGAVKKLDTDLTLPPGARARVRQTLALTYFRLGLEKESIPLLEKVVDYYLTTYGPDDPRTLDNVEFLAQAYALGGRPDAAIKVGEEYLPRMRRILGLANNDTLWLMQHLASGYFRVGRLEEGLAMQGELLPLAENALGREHNDTLWFKDGLANSLNRAGRVDEALRMREDILKARRTTNGPEHPYTLYAELALADAYSSAGRREEAVQLVEKLVPRMRKVLDPEHRWTMRAIERLANWKEAAGKLDQALALKEEMVILHTKTSGANHSNTVSAIKSLAKTYRAKGDSTKAASLEEQAASISASQSKLVTAEAPSKSNPTDVETLSRTGKFAEAARATRPRIEELAGYGGVNESIEWMILAATLLAAQDREGYRAACAAAVRRFHDTSDPKHADRVAKMCLLAPDSGVDAATLSGFVALAQTNMAISSIKPWVQLLNALAEYRLGHWEAASEWATQMRANPDAQARATAAAAALLAMAEHRRQRPAEARAALKSARDSISTAWPQGADSSWYNWLIADLLAREAEALLK